MVLNQVIFLNFEFGKKNHLINKNIPFKFPRDYKFVLQTNDILSLSLFQ